MQLIKLLFTVALLTGALFQAQGQTANDKALVTTSLYYDLSTFELVNNLPGISGAIPADNLIDNELHIREQSDVTYSKAELLDMTSGKAILNMNLTPTERAIDLSDVAPGPYTLMLTNDAGEVKTEKITIIYGSPMQEE